MRSVAIVCFLVAGTAHADPLDTVVQKLGALACRQLGAFEAVIGPQHYKPDDLMSLPIKVANADKLGVRSATAQLSIDWYHQDPRSVKDPPVGELELVFTDKVDLGAVVGALPGAVHFAVDKDTIWHAGALYASSAQHELSVMCGVRPPPWAQQPWTAKDASAAAKAVIVALGPDAPAAATKDERYELQIAGGEVTAIFKTPLAAGDLLAAIGAKRVTLRAVDVHMSRWVLHGSDGKALMFGGRRVEITIDETGIDKLAKQQLDPQKLLMTSLSARRP